MKLHLSPYVHYPNNDCAEAFAFYGSAFGVEPIIMRGRDMQAEDMADLVMHAELPISEGVALYGSDDCMGHKAKPQGFEACLFTDDLEQARRWFDALSDGAEVHLALEPREWGDTYGQLTDRYGLTWAINVSAPTH